MTPGDPESPAGAGRFGEVATRLLVQRGHRLDVAFTIGLLAFVGSLLIMTLEYGSQTRLVPLVIGVPTFGLLLVLLAVQLSPRLAEAGRRIGGASLLDVREQIEEIGSTSGRLETEADTVAVRLEVLAVSAWVILLFLVVVLVGFVIGTLGFLLAFYRLRARQSWARTVLYSVVVWVLTVVVFKVVLNTPLHTGLLGIEVPLPL